MEVHCPVQGWWKAQGRPEQINKNFISDLLQCGITCSNQHIQTEKMEARAARCITRKREIRSFLYLTRNAGPVRRPEAGSP